MNSNIEDNRIHEGHRERMRSKLLGHGHKIFDTYELLEMLLYYIVPYKDTNPIAKRLLASFGSLEGVLSAEPAELERVSGIGKSAAEFLVCCGGCQGLLGIALGKGEGGFCADYSSAGNHFVDCFKNITYYSVAAAFLDNSMRIIDTVELYDMDYERAKIKPARIIEAAIRSRASAVITAHCHPYGPLFPTAGDRVTNSLITDSLESVGVIHLEHFLISGKKYMGIMEHTKELFSANSGIYSFLLSKEMAIAEGRSDSVPCDHLDGIYHADYSGSATAEQKSVCIGRKRKGDGAL